MRANAKYTGEMVDFVKANIPCNRQQLLDRFNERFGMDIGMECFSAFLCSRKIHCSTRVVKWKGQKSKPIGTEREKKGYVQVKTVDGWKQKQVAVWEEAHGKLPENHYVIFLDRNNRNFALENLEAIPMRIIGCLNNIWKKDDTQDEARLRVAQAKIICATRDLQVKDGQCVKGGRRLKERLRRYQKKRYWYLKKTDNERLQADSRRYREKAKQEFLLLPPEEQEKIRERKRVYKREWAQKHRRNQ